jgi:7-cyano-7-deazaguanine synthase
VKGKAMRTPSRKAIVMLSGGLDSATTAAIAAREGFDVSAITFRYGQRHAIEVAAAKRVAADLGITDHVFIDLDLRAFGGSALTGDIEVPQDRTIAEMSASIPVTYVPARNTIFLSYALAFAEVSGSFDIFAGMNALDYAGYPDCRPAYVAAFEAMANLATKSAIESGRQIRIHTPLISQSKAEIIRQGLAIGVNYALTSSCYAPASDGTACGRCDACRLRIDGFRENGLEDPILYQGQEMASV